MNEKKEKRTFVFELKKPFKELASLCNIFNVLFGDNNISFKFKLQNVPTDFLTLSFYYENQELLVMNRDLIRKIVADDLLKANEINQYIKDGYFPTFSTDKQGAALEISFFESSSNNSGKEFSCNVPRDLPCILSTKAIKIKLDVPVVQSLVNISNSILENGHLFASIIRKKENLAKLKLDIYLCHPNRASLQLSFDLMDDDFNEILTLSKLNFASSFHSRVIINYNSPELSFDLYEPRIVQEKQRIRNQFNILDSIYPEV